MVDETAKTVFLITGEDNFKKFRANGTQDPKGISYLYREQREKVPDLGLLFEYIVDDSAVLRCENKSDANFIKQHLDERQIDYQSHPYSEYLSICAEEFAKK